MNISEKKEIERNIFKKLRKKNSNLIEQNVEKNEKIYINSNMNKGIKNKDDLQATITLLREKENDIDTK